MSAILEPGVTQKYNLGPVKPWVQSAAYFLGPRHNIKTIGGWRKTDPFPDHPSGHALDFMIPDLATGESLAQDAINNAGPLGIKYIIFNHRVWNPQQGWHPYTSTSNPHTDHVHITFNDTPGTGAPGGSIPAGGSVDSGVIQGVALTGQAAANCAWQVYGTCLLSKTAARQIFGGLTILLGTGVIVAGMVLLTANSLKKVKGLIP